jgi:serine/threonine protein kinase
MGVSLELWMSFTYPTTLPPLPQIDLSSKLPTARGGGGTGRGEPVRRRREPEADETRHPRIAWLSREADYKGDGSPSNDIPSSSREVEVLGAGSYCAYCEKELDSTVRPFERRFYEECVPMADWHSFSFPSCNPLHEVDLVGLDSNYEDNVTLLSLKGSWRSVWSLTTANKETVALKLLHISRKFDHESFEHHRVDALAMERLTSNPYIVNVFGYCGQSVLSEFATSSARQFLKNPAMSSEHRLKMARDIARAVTAVHSIDFTNSTNVTLTHNDINMANAIEVDGRIKLNDFNLARLLRWNATSSTVCHTAVRYASPLWKSPEENAAVNKSAVDAAACDVYATGNLLFQVLTKRQPWTHLEPAGPFTPDEAALRKAAGQLPHIPAKYRPDHPNQRLAVVAMYFAVTACFRPDPAARPTSHQLMTGLETALEWVRGLKKGTVNVTFGQVRDLFRVDR